MTTVKNILCMLAISLMASYASAQSAGNFIYNNTNAGTPQYLNTHVNFNDRAGSYTELKAEVMMNVKATSFGVIFSATQHGVTAEETDSFMTIRLDLVKQGLRHMGIHDSCIHIDVISMVPTYSLNLEKKKFSQTANEIPTGFQMKKNIHILLFDHDRLPDVVSLMAKSEIYDIVRVDYNLNDIDGVYDQLREEAIEVIRQKEKNYNKIGLHLETQNIADGFHVAYPAERYTSYTAYHTGSTVEEIRLAKKRKQQVQNIIVTGKKAKVNVRMGSADEDDSKFIIRHSEKNKTIYYNKIPYNQFDRVINADMADVRIQFVYTLKVRYASTNMKRYEEMKRMEKEREEKQKQLTEQPKKKWFR